MYRFAVILREMCPYVPIVIKSGRFHNELFNISFFLAERAIKKRSFPMIGVLFVIIHDSLQRNAEVFTR